MHERYRKRLLLFCVMAICISTAIGLILYALRQNISLYYTPTELLKQPKKRQEAQLRLGGYVAKHSVHFQKHSLLVNFVVTDYHHRIRVLYRGVLPNLFREGQGIVVQGKLNAQDELVATQVLAKHDAIYHPPQSHSVALRVSHHDA